MAVVFGLILEVIFAALFHDPPEAFLSRWGPVIADVVVALGVAGEVFLGRRARIESEELSRRAEEKLGIAMKRAAEADARAAEARERTAEIERFTAWRRVPVEQARQIADNIRGRAASLDVLIEYQIGDPEAFAYNNEIAMIFLMVGVTRIRHSPNSYPLNSTFVTGHIPLSA
jgi:hypothetical protein